MILVIHSFLQDLNSEPLTCFSQILPQVTDFFSCICLQHAVLRCGEIEGKKIKMDHFTFMENVAEQEKEKTQLTEKTRL